MSGAVELTSRSARVDRLRAHLPRVALLLLIGVLAVSATLGALRSDAASKPVLQRLTTVDRGAEAFAEGFARAYLSADPDDRERELSDYLLDDLDPEAGVSRAPRSRTVSWTAVEGDRPRGRRHTVTVVAQTSDGVLRLAVPVERDRRGFLFVAAYPALVGPPPTNTGADVPDEDEVADPRLRAVVERALANYLGGERRNLLADLAPGAVVSLPPQSLQLESVDELTWVRARRTAAAVVEARDPDGGSWALRYELGVQLRERWYVRWLAVDPTERGDLQ